VACRAAGLGALLLLPVAPREGQAATRILLRGIKGGRGPDALLPPLVLHDAAGGFRMEADAVLRGAAALPATSVP
jgi:tRNA1(Val) A37 N6-methylase TrmN6